MVEWTVGSSELFYIYLHVPSLKVYCEKKPVFNSLVNPFLSFIISDAVLHSGICTDRQINHGAIM